MLAKIAIIAGYARSLINFRGELIKEFIRYGHQVIAMAPEQGFERKITSLGAQYCSIPLDRNGCNIFKDLFALFSLWRKLKKEKPDVILAYTVKPVIYGSLAALLNKTPHIYSMITGLGYAYTGNTLKHRILEKVVSFLYRQALKNNQKVFFQNPDDLHLFTSKKLVDCSKTVLINGSGVDINSFSFVEPKMERITFLLIARIIKDKGIREFVEAARLVKERYPGICFKLLGPFESNPAAIYRQEVLSWANEGLIEYLGDTDDVRPYIIDSSVYVLPSYREGTPRTILEAMAVGRAVITTDAPGCRETVKNGVNGFLVPVKDHLALAAAMERYILNPKLVLEMGLYSRYMVTKKYNVSKVNRKILQTMCLNRQGTNCKSMVEGSK